MDSVRAQIHENLVFLGNSPNDIKIIVTKDRPGGKYIGCVIDVGYRSDMPVYCGKPHHTIEGSLESLLDEIAEAVLHTHPRLYGPPSLRFETMPPLRFQAPSSAPLMPSDLQDPFVVHRQ